MEKTASYYRSRLKAFEKLIEQEVGNTSNDERDLRILRNGVVPARLQPAFDLLIGKYQKGQSDQSLSFGELTRFNTWFEMFPEKVAGLEAITSSRDFPIVVKGTEEDIIRTVTPSVKKIPEPKDKRIRIAKARAMARKRVLELMKN